MPPKKARPRAGGRQRQQSVSFKGGRRGADDVAGGSIAEADVKRTGVVPPPAPPHLHGSLHPPAAHQLTPAPETALPGDRAPLFMCRAVPAAGILWMDRPTVASGGGGGTPREEGPLPRLVVLGGKTIEYWLLPGGTPAPTEDDVARARAEPPLGVVALADVLSVAAKVGGGGAEGRHGLVVQGQFRSHTLWAAAEAERAQWVADISAAVDDWQELSELLREAPVLDLDAERAPSAAALLARARQTDELLLRSRQTASAKAQAAERYREDAAAVRS